MGFYGLKRNRLTTIFGFAGEVTLTQYGLPATAWNEAADITVVPTAMDEPEQEVPE